MTKIMGYKQFSGLQNWSYHYLLYTKM